MIGGLGQTFFTLIDSVLIGKILGWEEMSAVAIANSFFFTLLFLIIGASSIIAPIFASLKAIDEKEKIKNLFKNSLIFHFMLGIFLYVLGIFLFEFLQYFKKNIQILNLSRQYLQIRLFSIFGLFLFLSFKRIAEGLSKTKYILYSIWISAGVNILSNYLFLDGKYGLPALGLEGAAWILVGTGILEASLLFFFLYKDKTTRFIFEINLKIDLHLKTNFSFSKGALASGIYSFLEASIFYVGTFLLAAQNPSWTAVHYINVHIMAILYRFIYAITVAAMVRIGHFFGLKELKSIQNVLFLALFLLGIVLILGGIVFLPFKNEWIQLFAKKNTTQELFILAAEVLPWAFLLKIFDALQMLFNQSLKGIQQSQKQFKNGIFAYLFCTLPLSYFFVIFQNQGVVGLWKALCIGMFVSMVLSGKSFYFNYQNIKKAS